MNQQPPGNSGHEDNELLRRAKAGDKEAFVTLIAAYEHIIHAISRSFHRKHGIDTDDLVQEVTVRAYTTLPRFRGTQALEFKAWLRKTAQGLCYNTVKQQKGIAEKDKVFHDRSRGDASRPDEEYAHTERKKCVRAAIGRLPEQYRKLVALKYFQGWRYGDIATHLNMPRGTVQSRLHRGCKQLKEHLKALRCDEMLD